MNNKKNNSSATQITRAYIILLTTLMIIVSFATIFVVGLHLVHNKRDDAEQLTTVLKTSFSDYKPDWDYWRDTASINPHNTFVRVTVVPDSGKVRHFYSHRTRKFLRDDFENRPLLKNIQIQTDQGIFYHVKTSERWKHSRVTYEIWLSLNNVVELFKLIIVVVISVMAFGLLIGISAISVLARKLNAPLERLTTATQKINDADTSTHHETLPVPAGPQEVTDLSIEFNRLLTSLNNQVLRDHQFVSDASHELRTPLAAIRGHINLIRRHGNTHPEIVQPSLSTIDTESIRMQHLIDSLLQLSRMDHAELEKQRVLLNDIVQRVADNYHEQLNRELVVNAPHPVHAMVHAESITQMLVALIDNANKYAPGDTPITINLFADSHAVIEVADLGPGISDGAKAHIFDRFYRADTSRSHKIDGSGLGLAIVARLADLNGGAVHVRDNQPQGSVFSLILPIIK
ncbi:sensor histidine kinase [Lacticaseibacillus hulanensis]|uniref:sensor histidine kinase n=1 Tax=Lacticaseibacillus hulanensis TaxID=2493111 RepID=UPI000FDA9452|nr:HAMP domain-containing sensor histidine kinase [Lacticaseibacillus hulanensis]